FTSPRGGVPVRPPAAEGQRVPIWPRVFATGPINIAEDANSATIAIDAYRASENPNGLQGAYTDIVFHLARVPGMDAWAIDRSATLAEIRSGAGGVFQSLRLPGLSPIRVDEI
ncbi:hypothetical protein RZS08_02000, partial [Arthrospira platensis SPKY1]|nr:hypothetical protein [Arthrospira platensis SPKY1]